LPNHTFGYSAPRRSGDDKHLLTVSGSITSTHESRYYQTGNFLGGGGAPNRLDPSSGDYQQLTGSYVGSKGTGKFDNMGAFSRPWRLTTSLQLRYQLSHNLHARLTLTGLTDTCIQRGYAWDRASFCAYSTLPFGAPSLRP